MMGPQLHDIKRAQKEAQLLREISSLILKITIDEPSLQGLYVSRIKLSPDKGMCHVLFITATGKEEFQQKLGALILYKPSMRAALAKILNGRYTPNLVFEFDELSDKQKRVDDLINKVSNEDL